MSEVATATRVRFRTETGSVYLLTQDEEGMRWQRETATLGSGVLRSDHGVLLAWPEFELGQRCKLRCEPINAPFERLVWSSRVVAFLDDRSDGAA
jgi:hypothetical protein